MCVREAGYEVEDLFKGLRCLRLSPAEGGGGARRVDRQAQDGDAFSLVPSAEGHRGVFGDQVGTGSPEDTLPAVESQTQESRGGF